MYTQPTPLHSTPTTIGNDDQRRFEALQQELAAQFKQVFPDDHLPRTVVVIPSLSLDPSELSKISGVHYYEERLLCMLMLLRMPLTRLVYVTSQPVDPTIIDYYLHLLPGIPVSHARKRLVMLSCHDSSPKSLTEKILDRPRLIQRIQTEVDASSAAHMTCFNATFHERALSLRLNIPLYAANPSLAWLGSKSGSREVFKEAGIRVPAGYENLRDEQDLIEGLVQLKSECPDLRKAVVKLNEGFSGEGNAIFTFEGYEGGSLKNWVTKTLPSRLKFEAEHESWEHFRHKFAEMQGIVEVFVEGKEKRSPSVQCRINPVGEAITISTHDQIMGGPSGQIFQGCLFPADSAYRLEVQQAGQHVAHLLKEHGVLGRFGIDFVSVKEDDGWKHYAIEINLRKGGTTHPFMMLQFLTDGHYDCDTGLYLTPTGQPRYYYASDNLQNELYQGLTPDDLIDIAVYHDLHFHSASQQGVMFHLIGALSEFGKLGVVCIGDSVEASKSLYDHTVKVLGQEVSQ